MKKTISIFLMIFISSHFYSQKALSADYSYTVSAPYKVFDATNKIYFTQDNEAMTLKFNEDEIVIQKFNTDKPSFIKEQKYEKFFPKDYFPEDILKVNNKYYLFYALWDKPNLKEQLFSIEIDFKKGEFIGTPKLVIQVDGRIFWSKENPTLVSSTGRNKFRFLQSYDKKNLMIQYRKIQEKEKKGERLFDIMGLYAYDENMNKISGQEIKMPYKENRMDNIDTHIDNSGSIYMLIKVFHNDSNEEKKDKNDTEANYHLELFLIKNGSDKIQISKFDNKDKFINKLWLFGTEKDYIICGGFYSNGKGYYGNSDGIITFKIKSDGSIYDEVSHEIPLEILNQYESAGTVRKNEQDGKDSQFSNLKFTDLVINDDGSLIFVGEQQYTTLYLGSGGTAYDVPYYDNLLVSKINANGTLAWMRKIPKSQEGAFWEKSYKFFKVDDYYYFIFLDNVKNIDLPVDKQPYLHKTGQGGYLTAVKIADSDGASKKESIMNIREVEEYGIHQISMTRFMRTGKNTLLFEAYKKKKEDVMIKMSLKLE